MNQPAIMNANQYALRAALNQIKRWTAIPVNTDELVSFIRQYIHECMEIGLEQDDLRNLFPFVLYVRKTLPPRYYPADKYQSMKLERALTAYLYLDMNQKGFHVTLTRLHSTQSALGISLHCVQNDLANIYEKFNRT